jgi:hypothetical protein
MRRRSVFEMNRIGLASAALFVAIPAIARAQSVPASASVTPRLPAGVEAVINRLADSARARGLPAEPLFSKAAEGALKGADSTRIVDAVRRLFGELDVARSTLKGCAGSAETVAAASALHAGVTPGQLAHVALIGCDRAGASAPKPDRLVMPLVVLADLVARRVSADVAVSSLEPLLARRAPDAEFANMRLAVEQDIAGGTAPDAAMRTRSAAVVRTLDARASRPPDE